MYLVCPGAESVFAICGDRTPGCLPGEAYELKGAFSHHVVVGVARR